MKFSTFIGAAFAFAVTLGTSAFAGSNEPAVVETPVIVMTDQTDWTGFYLGVGVGQTNSTTTETATDVFGGYRYEFDNNVVVGGEAGYTWNQGTVADNTNVSAMIGYSAANWLPYVHAGYAWDDTSLSGTTYGAGVDYKLNDRHVIGAKFTRNDYGLNDTKLSLRYAFNF